MNGFDSPEFSPAEEAARDANIRDANIRDIVHINESKLYSAHQKIADLEKALIQKEAQLEALYTVIREWGNRCQ